MPGPLRPAGAGVITIGTPWGVVEGLMGPPKFSAVIPCLHRSKLVYDDGTEILIVQGCVISVAPGATATGDPVHGVVIDRLGRTIFFEPVVLRAGGFGFTPELKRDVEQCFNFAPPLADRVPPPPPPFEPGPPPPPHPRFRVH